MSRFRLIFALSISIALIGVAGWYRFTRTTTKHVDLIAVQNLNQDVILVGSDFIGTETKASDDTPLTQADLIGRQLFSDYIDLSTGSGVTAENLNSLAEKYTQEILEGTPSRKVELNQILVIPDSTESLSRYSEKISANKNKYGNLVEAQYLERRVTSDINGQSFKEFINSIGELYESSAEELLATQAPVSLAQYHQGLINNYFSSASAMEMLSNVNKDPIGAYSAINTQIQNSKEEYELLSNIQTALAANGIIFEQTI